MNRQDPSPAAPALQRALPAHCSLSTALLPGPAAVLDFGVVALELGAPGGAAAPSAPIPMETQPLCPLCMAVPSLDSLLVAVLFLKAVTLAEKGEHVGKELGTDCSDSFTSGLQVLSSHSGPLQAGRAEG